MTLTTRNARNGLAAIAGVVSRQLVNQFAQSAARYAVDSASNGTSALINYIKEPGRQANRSMAVSRTAPMQGIRSVSRKSKGRKKNRGRRIGNPVPLYNDRIRVTLSDALTFVNSSNNNLQRYLQLANSLTGSADFSLWLPRARTISGSFRQFRIKRACFHWRPSTAYTVGGYLIMGIDPDPSSGTPGNIGDVVRHHPHCLSDIKDCADLVWTPEDDMEDSDKLTNASGITTAPNQVSQGTFQILSVNSLADVTTNIGVLTYEIDVEFFGLY